MSGREIALAGWDGLGRWLNGELARGYACGKVDFR